MNKILFILLVLLATPSCVTVPVDADRVKYKCELSTNKKTLKVVDVAEETNSYYSVSGILLSPILVPTTALISGTYVLVHNTYNLGEEVIKCGGKAA